MTVKELIKELLNFPMDLDVAIQHPDSGWPGGTVAEVKLRRDAEEDYVFLTVD